MKSWHTEVIRVSQILISQPSRRVSVVKLPNLCLSHSLHLKYGNYVTRVIMCAEQGQVYKNACH